MSNCIQFVDGEMVSFTASEINIPRFKALIDRVKYLPKAPDDQLDPSGYVAWWFLDRNTNFVDGKVVINFGLGRSSHTHRDFRWTCNIISKFMLKSKIHKFCVSVARLESVIFVTSTVVFSPTKPNQEL